MVENSEFSLEIVFESSHFTAGDYVSGLILVNSPEIQCKLDLSSSGTEQISLISKKDQAKEYKIEIFSVTKQVAKATRNLQESYPFSFKIPEFCPSSFSLDHSLSDGSQMLAEIFYSINLSLTKDASELLNFSKRFIVFNKISQNATEQKALATQTLRSCLCFPRGNVELSVSGQNCMDSICGDLFKYQIRLISPSNKHLDSLVSQVVFDFNTKIPGQAEIRFQKALSRVVTDVKSLKSQREISINLDLSLNTEEIVGNLCSNHAGYMNSKYFLQVFAVYDVGWRSKLVELELEMQITPCIAAKSERVLGWVPVKMPECVFEAIGMNSNLYLPPNK